MNKVLVIVGPTGVGKSDLGIELAKKYNGEIISGDSIQVYRGLNIGSAKVTNKEMQDIPHYLIDILDLKDNYNVCDFQKQAREKIEDIVSRGKLPIIVGGTGLYIKALLYDYEFLEEEETDDTEYDSYTNEELLEELRKIDYKASLKIHVNNRKRLVRALKMCKSGKKKSEIIDEQTHQMIYDAKIIGLTVNRDLLYERINQRVDKMMKLGLKEEVQHLYLQDENLFSYRGMQGIGYREWEPYFKSFCRQELIVEDIKKHSRQFAKRQYTWFNNQMELKWFDILDKNYKDNITMEIEEWL